MDPKRKAMHRERFMKIFKMEKDSAWNLNIGYKMKVELILRVVSPKNILILANDISYAEELITFLILLALSALYT